MRLSLIEKHTQGAAQRRQHKVDAIRRTYPTMDAGTLVSVAQDLQYVEEEVSRIIFEPSVASTAIPFVSVSDAYDSVAFNRVEHTGRARTVARGADDYPKVAATVERTVNDVLPGGVFYEYSVDSQRMAVNLRLDEAVEGASAAATEIKRWHDSFALIGDALANRTGFINNADVEIVTKVSTTANWAHASTTGADIYNDVAKLYYTLIDQVDGNPAFTPNALGLSVSRYQLMATKRIGTDNSDTVLTTIRKNLPGFQVENSVYMWPALELLDAEGDGNRIVMYRKSPQVVRYVPTVLYEEDPPERHAFMFRVYARGKAAGTNIKYPEAVAYMDVI